MEKLGLNEIREKYLSFFEKKEHLRLPSFSLVPENDPSLLLINAGMAPLKPYFTGRQVPPKKRVTTCQKCIRTPDIERVGKTARHGTFFEMLGNFSFGDYFKHEATRWAWEFVTEEMKMPVDKLWVTIYEDDDEAFDIWTKEVGVSPDRIVRMGKEDNFWEIGTGPCGPCSEIYFDRGEEFGCGSPDCKIGCDCDRFVEFWNLVFTQFDKQADGTYLPLDNPNIDTGMGLERIACIMQGVTSLFDVDTIANVIKKVCEIANVKYKEDADTDVSIRVVTDHIRSTVFIVSDGVLPSNEGRGYVLRRLLRRAARHGKLLGIEGTFLSELADTVINESKGAYPILEEKRDTIKSIIKTEEERFAQTIDQGFAMLNEILEKKELKDGVLSGSDAFKLYDTFGFPIDLTRELLEEKGLSLDEDGFNVEMNAQRERAREAQAKKGSLGWENRLADILTEATKTEFVGYDTLETDAKVLMIIADGEKVKSKDSGEVIVVLDKTSFYAESGGQTGDKGIIKSNNSELKVKDTQKTPDGKFYHIAEIVGGELTENDTVKAIVDKDNRFATQRNHSVTHLLHKALKNHLGDHIGQAGSLVSPDRMRFDFTHNEAISAEILKDVELEVNGKILESIGVKWENMPIEEAQKTGATAMFGDKYGEIVRVVSMGDYSVEFCGGCHVTNTSQIGLFKILSESGVAAGVRRIEAVTGLGVLAELYSEIETNEKTALELKCSKNEIAKKAQAVMSELKEANKEIESLNARMANSSIGDILDSAKDVKGVKVICGKLSGANIDALRSLGDSIKEKEDSAFICLASDGEKVTFITMATKKAVAKGVHAGNAIREIAKIAGGGGGGKPDSAQAGGKDASKIDDALNAAYTIIEGMIK